MLNLDDSRKKLLKIKYEVTGILFLVSENILLEDVLEMVCKIPLFGVFIMRYGKDEFIKLFHKFRTLSNNDRFRKCLIQQLLTLEQINNSDINLNLLNIDANSWDAILLQLCSKLYREYPNQYTQDDLIRISDYLYKLLNKKEDQSSYFNLMTGTSYLWKFRNFTRNFFGSNIGYHNLKEYNDKNNKNWYYKIDLDIVNYGKDANDKIKELNLINNGLNFQFKIQTAKNKLFSLKDNLEFNIIFQDNITKNFLYKPFFNSNINYVTWIFNKLLFQNNLEFLWSHPKNSPYKEVDINLIGKYYSNDLNKTYITSIVENEKKKEYEATINNQKPNEFHWGIHNLSILNFQLKKLDLFIGQQILIFLGIYNDLIFYQDIKNQNYFLKFYTGIIFTIRIQFLTFNFYFPFNLLSQDEGYVKAKFMDFTIDTSMNVNNNYQSNFIHKSNLPLSKNMLE